MTRARSVPSEEPSLMEARLQQRKLSRKKRFDDEKEKRAEGEEREGEGGGRGIAGDARYRGRLC